MSYFFFPPRQTAAQRRADAARRIKDAAKRGTPMTPVTIAATGRAIARTFWGKSWCANLERYRDFAHRLERGRSYVRGGAVIDLRIGAGEVTASVLGSELYDVSIRIDEVDTVVWRAIHKDCAGDIQSRVALLAGDLSESVMTRLCADRVGLFPAPSAIRFTCSCPDYAIMCKHVAAAMYGIGARLDDAPELLFVLRGVSADELVASAHARPMAASTRVLAGADLSALFGIEIIDCISPPTPSTAARSPRPRRAATPASPGARGRRR